VRNLPEAIYVSASATVESSGRYKIKVPSRVPRGYCLLLFLPCHSFRTFSAFPPFSFSISATLSHSAASFRNFLPCVFELNG
jgi:hypothetical protein